MNAYFTNHETAAGTDKTIVNITGSASQRIGFYDTIIGNAGPVDDQTVRLVAGLTTSVGTGGTTLSENPGDPLSPASFAAAVGGSFSGEPAFTANSERLRICLNLRATFRWVAVTGREIWSVVSANNGIALLCKSITAGTPNLGVTMAWIE